MNPLMKSATLSIAAAGVLATAAPAVALPAFETPHVAGIETAIQPAEQSWRDRRDNRTYGNRRYSEQPVYRNTRVWRGRDGRYYCRRQNGTTGLVIGGAVGGLLGHEVAGRGDRTLGTILGVAGGALLGREIDKSSARCR